MYHSKLQLVRDPLHDHLQTSRPAKRPHVHMPPWKASAYYAVHFVGNSTIHLQRKQHSRHDTTKAISHAGPVAPLSSPRSIANL